jgi:putative membrane protein
VNDERNTLEYLILFLKGCAMGICDIIPGVSGGTIALITGIYERLVTAIGNIRPQAAVSLAKRDWDGVRTAVAAVDPKFLITLGAGIGAAALLMANIILLLLEYYAVPTYAFFFGLIIASSALILLEVEERTTKVWLFLVAGFAGGFLIAGLSPASLGHSLPVLFFTGMVALCAMILPGISGAYLTLILNQYEYLLNAVKTLSLPDIIAYMAGGVLGLLLFSKALKYLLRHHHGVMLGCLTGLMLGSTRLLADTIGTAGGFDTQAYLFTAVGIAVIVLMEYVRRRMAA